MTNLKQKLTELINGHSSPTDNKKTYSDTKSLISQIKKLLNITQKPLENAQTSNDFFFINKLNNPLKINNNNDFQRYFNCILDFSQLIEYSEFLNDNYKKQLLKHFNSIDSNAHKILSFDKDDNEENVNNILNFINDKILNIKFSNVIKAMYLDDNLQNNQDFLTALNTYLSNLGIYTKKPEIDDNITDWIKYYEFHGKGSEPNNNHVVLEVHSLSYIISYIEIDDLDEFCLLKGSATSHQII